MIPYVCVQHDYNTNEPYIPPEMKGQDKNTDHLLFASISALKAGTSPLPESLTTDQLPSLRCSFSPSFSRSPDSVLGGVFCREDRDLARANWAMSECDVRGWSRVDVTLSRELLSGASGNGLIKDFAYSCARVSDDGCSQKALPGPGRSTRWLWLLRSPTYRELCA